MKLEEHKRYNSPEYHYESQKLGVLLSLIYSVPVASAALLLSAMVFLDLSPLQALWDAGAYLLLLGGFAFLTRKRSFAVLVILDFLNRRRLQKQETSGLADQ